MSGTLVPTGNGVPAGTQQNFKILGIEIFWVPMGTGYQPGKNFGYRVPAKKKFRYRLVPGTGQIFNYADPW